MDQQQRFELLSAYIDGEVTDEEKQAVEEWLSRDQQAQNHYQSILKLRYQLQALPSPTPTPSAEALTDTVIRQSYGKTLKKGLLWGGGAVTAVLITALSGLFASNQSPMPRLAESNEGNDAPEALTIALDEPIADASHFQTSSEQLQFSLIQASSEQLHLPLNQPLINFSTQSNSVSSLEAQ